MLTSADIDPDHEGSEITADVIRTRREEEICHFRKSMGTSRESLYVHVDSERVFLLSDAEGREDQIQNVVGGGFAGERVEMTKGSV